jgi:hypothetical protein
VRFKPESAKLAPVSIRTVRRGRVKGYRPTREQLIQMLELAQGGFSEQRSVTHLTHSRDDDREIDAPDDERDDVSRGVPDYLDYIIREADDPDELNNLTFSISQVDPIRQVLIRIGPGDWTEYTIESTDRTWALGRYHELTDKLLKDRSPYSKAAASRPEILRDGVWKSAEWEPAKDWRAALAGFGSGLTFMPGLAEIAVVFAIFSGYYVNGPDRQDRNNHHQALQAIHWAGGNVIIIVGLTLSYLIALVACRRWLASLRRSRIILNAAPRLSQFSFQSSTTDPVILASFYILVLTLILTGLDVLIR